MPVHSTPQSNTRVARMPALDQLEILHAQLRGHGFPVHFHGTYVIEWVTEGVDQCSASGSAAGQGQLFAHGPGVPHAGGCPLGQRLSYVACYPSRKLVAQVTGMNETELPSLGTAVLESKVVRRDSERLFGTLALASEAESAMNERHARKHLRSLMLRLFDAVEHAPVRPDRGTAHALAIAKQHLTEYARRGVELRELAAVAGLSRFHLAREFKRAFGITPRRFQISERVSVARRLISAGAPLADAAASAGFADQSHMTRVFQAVAAFSPGKLQA